MLQKLSKSVKNILLIFGLIFFAGLFRCSTYNPAKPEGGTAPEISDLFAPSVVYNLSSLQHSISVQTADPQGLDDLADVRFGIIKSGSSTPVISGVLLDDGTSGDVIPKDGRFTTQIQGSLFQNDTGEFNLEIIATDKNGNVSNSLQTRIFVLAGAENNLPEIVSVSVPATVLLDSLFDFLVEVEVSDADSLSDIEYVFSQFFPPAHANPTRQDTLSDDGLSGDVTPDDGIYSLILSSGLINETSDYFLRFQAQDKSGNRSLAAVATIRGKVAQPEPPVISNLVAPDTVQIVPAQVVQVLITIDVTDPQGLSDIDFVRFRSFLPNGNEAGDSPIGLADDGDAINTGDEIAGDGTYSRIINLPPTAIRGNFRFVFEARDKSGLFSNTIEHIMTVID
ncbi:hypothetical protein IH824_18455 [candidate division KSB1 bacterium]|nr:hypothetical protein [candidate division KSB1 bacterium]